MSGAVGREGVWHMSMDDVVKGVKVEVKARREPVNRYKETGRSSS